MDSNRKVYEIESVAREDTKKKEIGTWKEFMNDRLLLKEKLKAVAMSLNITTLENSTNRIFKK
jgi:hypothetical protein